MMRKFSTWLLGLLMATVISACCGSVACECNDVFADALYFRFNRADTLTTGFRTVDIDTVFLVRLPYDDTQVEGPPTTPPDVVSIIRSRATVDSLIILNNNAPFAVGGNRKLDAYTYRLFVVRHFPEGTIPRRDTVFYALDEIRLKGRFTGDGCCTCYQNEGKRLRITRGKVGDATGKIVELPPTDNAAPQPILLSR